MAESLRILMLVLVLTPLSLPTQAIEEGEVAIASLGTDADGEPVLPETLRGKVVIALYWASWCGYCRKAMPDFLQFQQVAEDHGLQVVFINTKEDRDVFRNARRWAGNSTALMAHDRKGTAMEAYGGEGFPFIVLMDRTGVVRKIGSGYGANSKTYYAKALTSLLAGNELPEEANRFTIKWEFSTEPTSAEAVPTDANGTKAEQ